MHLGRFRLALKILITGGLGFIGGRLASYLALAGHQVRIGTRNIMVPPEWLPQGELVRIEWENEQSLANSCKNIDVIVHAAGMNASECMANPVAALAFNGLATARLIAVAERVGVSKFIYISTAHVYASPLTGLINEDTSPHNNHPYATSHLAGEHALLDAVGTGAIEGIVLRLSNAFGSPMQKDVNCWMLLVNDLCRQAVCEKKITLLTDGLQQRDFIGINQVCQLFSQLLDGKYSTVKNIINVGSGSSLSVIDMAHMIQERCSKTLGFTPPIHRKKVNTQKINEKLFYESNVIKKLEINLQNKKKIEEIDGLLQFCKKEFT